MRHAESSGSIAGKVRAQGILGMVAGRKRATSISFLPLRVRLNGNIKIIYVFISSISSYVSSSKTREPTRRSPLDDGLTLGQQL